MCDHYTLRAPCPKGQGNDCTRRPLHGREISRGTRRNGAAASWTTSARSCGRPSRRRRRQRRAVRRPTRVEGAPRVEDACRCGRRRMRRPAPPRRAARACAGLGGGGGPRIPGGCTALLSSPPLRPPPAMPLVARPSARPPRVVASARARSSDAQPPSALHRRSCHGLVFVAADARAAAA